MALSLSGEFDTQPVRMCTSSDSFVFVPTDVPSDVAWIASNWHSLTRSISVQHMRWISLQFAECHRAWFFHSAGWWIGFRKNASHHPANYWTSSNYTLFFFTFLHFVCELRRKKVIDSSYSVFATLAAMSSNISRRVFGEYLDWSRSKACHSRSSLDLEIRLKARTFQDFAKFRQTKLDARKCPNRQIACRNAIGY